MRISDWSSDVCSSDLLDHDLAGVGGGGAVDLRDRRGADRGRIDRGEQRIERLAEARAHRLANRVERHRGQRVLEAQQVAGGFLADQIGPGRERLAELDRGGGTYDGMEARVATLESGVDEIKKSLTDIRVTLASIDERPKQMATN